MFLIKIACKGTAFCAISQDLVKKLWKHFGFSKYLFTFAPVLLTELCI